MGKKIYRSLFDSPDVFEVEELSDEPDTNVQCGGEQDNIAKVKASDADEETVSNAQLRDLLKDILEAIKGKKEVSDSDQDPNTGGSTKGCEPAGEMKVESVDPIIDEDGADEDDEEKKVKVETETKTEKEVKDAYSNFTKVSGIKDSADLVTSTQVAFQNRYNKVANK